MENPFTNITHIARGSRMNPVSFIVKKYDSFHSRAAAAEKSVMLQMWYNTRFTSRAAATSRHRAANSMCGVVPRANVVVYCMPPKAMMLQ